MATEKTPTNFEPASDEVLMEAGWDPSQILERTNPEEDGPYVVVRVRDIICNHCGNFNSGWTILNIATATGGSETWSHDEAQTEAEEEANKLNHVWLEGYNSRKVRENKDD